MAPRFDCFIPFASTATKVTSAMPIMRAAAVEAVRPGFRREFSFATPFTIRSGRRFGNSAGHSGLNPRTLLRAHMIATTRSSRTNNTAKTTPSTVDRARAARTTMATSIASPSSRYVTRFRPPRSKAAARTSQ
jgi:hypothetical protein